MGKGCAAIPQEVGELTRNGGVRLATATFFTYLESIDGLYPIAGSGVFDWENLAGRIREAYRDFAHIIHQRFCYNREA